MRANLDQLIGGATEETIVARVGEGIVSAIGSAETHAEVLENPGPHLQGRARRKLDSQTAFEILSIDIADIDVGDNIGARLQADQAEADTRVARAQAEGRRAMAVSQEQENIAKIEENRAKLVEAEASVPLPWPRPSAAASWASSTITNSTTCRPIPTCAAQSRWPADRGGSNLASPAASRLFSTNHVHTAYSSNRCWLSISCKSRWHWWRASCLCVVKQLMEASKNPPNGNAKLNRPMPQPPRPPQPRGPPSKSRSPAGRPASRSNCGAKSRTFCVERAAPHRPANHNNRAGPGQPPQEKSQPVKTRRAPPSRHAPSNGSPAQSVTSSTPSRQPKWFSAGQETPIGCRTRGRACNCPAQNRWLKKRRGWASVLSMKISNSMFNSRPSSTTKSER